MWVLASSRYGGDTRLKDTERRLYVTEREKEKLSERASKAEVQYLQAVDQLDNIMQRVAQMAKHRPAHLAHASTTMRNHVRASQSRVMGD